MKNIIKRCLDRSYQKPGSFNFNQFSILQQITSEEFFSREDKDSRLRLATFSFKCYTCSFKGSYSSKTVCCCGTTLRRKGLSQ